MKDLITINCGSHGVTWFIVITSLLISISNTGTIRRGIEMYIFTKSSEFRSCLLSVHEQTTLKLIVEQINEMFYVWYLVDKFKIGRASCRERV